MDVELYVKRIKELHLSNFIFYVLGKFLFGLGLGILLTIYFVNPGWVIAGWMFIMFAIIVTLPAGLIVFRSKKKSRK